MMDHRELFITMIAFAGGVIVVVFMSVCVIERVEFYLVFDLISTFLLVKFGGDLVKF